MSVATRLLDSATDFLNVLERGILPGVRSNNTERLANRTAFNAAIDEANSTGKILVVPPSIYEIYGGPITIPYGSFRWLGTTRSYITQYQLNAPVLHVGPAYGTAATTCEAVQIDGACLKYAGTGTTGARGLELTGVAMSLIENIDIGDPAATLSARTSVPYEGLHIDPTTGTKAADNNTYRNIRIAHFGWRGVNAARPSFDVQCTGCTWENILISGGTSAGAQDLGAATDSCGAFFQAHDELQLRSFKIKWMKAPNALVFDTSREVDTSGLRIEGFSVKMPAAGIASFIRLLNSRIKAEGFGFSSNVVLTANNVNSARIFSLGTGSSVELGNYRVEKTTKTSPPATPDLALFGNDTTAGDSSCAFQIASSTGLGTTHNLNRFDGFAFASGAFGGLTTQLAGFNTSTPCAMGNADATYYAGNTPGILIGTPSGAARTWTFSQYVSATDPTILPRGVKRIIRREGGTTNLLVANFDGTVIATLSSDGATCEIVCDENGSWRVVSVTGGTSASTGTTGDSEPFQPFGLVSHQNEASKYTLWSAAGVQWLRFDFPWSEMESTQGTFNWSGWDTAVSTAKSLGLKIVAILGYVPSWANGGQGQNYVPLVGFETNWQNYINQVVTRYGNQVDYWEIWDEPDNDGFLINQAGSWASINYPSDTPAVQKVRQYKHLVDLALGQAGLAGKNITTSGFSRGGSYDPNFIPWLISADSTWLKKFGVASHHCYGWNSAQDADSYSRLITEPAAFEAFGTQIGQTGWPLWITEHGITSGTGAGATQDRTYLIRSFALAMQQPGVKKLFWFRGGYDPNHRDMLTQSDQQTDVYYAYQTLTGKWVNPVSFASYVNGNVNGTIARLANNSRMAVLWCDSGSPAINSLGLNVSAAWDVSGNSISTSNTVGLAPVFVGLSD